MFLLTGKMGRQFKVSENKNVTTELPEANNMQCKSIDLDCKRTSKRIVEKYLKRFERDPERYSLTASFYCEEGGHAYHLKKVSGDTIILVNPWDSDSEIVMSKGEFLSKARSITVWDTKESGFWQNVEEGVSDIWNGIFS